MYKQTGIKPKELKEAKEFPIEMLYLWSWFVSLKSLSSPLTYTEIKSWSDLSDIRLLPWELDALIKLEQINSGGK